METGRESKTRKFYECEAEKNIAFLKFYPPFLWTEARRGIEKIEETLPGVFDNPIILRIFLILLTPVEDWNLRLRIYQISHPPKRCFWFKARLIGSSTGSTLFFSCR